MKVVVLGATGVVGRAAVEHFSAVAGCEVVAVSRRPLDLPGVVHASVDLADAAATAHAVRTPAFRGTTHVVYAALQESSDLAAGWRDPALMARNLDLFRHALEPLVAEHGATLEHVSLLQGAKAYGLHVGRTPLPAKERAPATTTRTSTSCRRTPCALWPRVRPGRGRCSARRSCSASRSPVP